MAKVITLANLLASSNTVYRPLIKQESLVGNPPGTNELAFDHLMQAHGMNW